MTQDAGCDGVRESSARFAKAESLEAGGWPVLGSGRSGLTLRFIERGRFGIGIVLHNRSLQTVTVVDASTPEPPGSLVQQVGTRLLPWNPPPRNGHHSRPAPALGPAQVLVTVGIGIRGWTTFHASTGIVTVARVAGSTLGGRFHATLVAPRRAPFRAYGVWRCTTNGH